MNILRLYTWVNLNFYSVCLCHCEVREFVMYSHGSVFVHFINALLLYKSLLTCLIVTANQFMVVEGYAGVVPAGAESVSAQDAAAEFQKVRHLWGRKPSAGHASAARACASGGEVPEDKVRSGRSDCGGAHR